MMKSDTDLPTPLIVILVVVIALLAIIRRRGAGKTNTNLTWYHYAMDLNFLLWLAVLGHVLPKATKNGDFSDSFLLVACAGFMLSLILQHRAYYDFKNPKTRVTVSTPNNQNGEQSHGADADPAVS